MRSIKTRLLSLALLMVGTNSCATAPSYPHEHYFYDRGNDRLVGKTSAHDRPGGDCDPDSSNYFNCVVYRLSEHERLKTRYLELVLKVGEYERMLQRCNK
jgi:hypothetical protein